VATHNGCELKDTRTVHRACRVADSPRKVMRRSHIPHTWAKSHQTTNGRKYLEAAYASAELVKLYASDRPLRARRCLLLGASRSQSFARDYSVKISQRTSRHTAIVPQKRHAVDDRSGQAEPATLVGCRRCRRCNVRSELRLHPFNHLPSGEEWNTAGRLENGYINL
jgi:hypothetical protein